MKRGTEKEGFRNLDIDRNQWWGGFGGSVYGQKGGRGLSLQPALCPWQMKRPDKAYSIYEKAKGGNVVYLDMLDNVIDQIGQWYGTGLKECGQERGSGSCLI